MQNNIIYDNEKNIYIFGMICDTKNEEDVTYLKVRCSTISLKSTPSPACSSA